MDIKFEISDEMETANFFGETKVILKEIPGHLSGSITVTFDNLDATLIPKKGTWADIKNGLVSITRKALWDTIEELDKKNNKV